MTCNRALLALAAATGVEGYSRKGDRPTSASHYYSFTRLTTSGTVTIGGEELPVQGQSWMDREFGSNQLGPDQQGWDWFSFSLDDGRDVMLYRVRDRADTSSFESGTMIDSEGRARPLAAGGWTATATSEWLSPATGTRYPAVWVVEVPSASLSLRVEPELPHQENRSDRLRDLFYWEGAVGVYDAATGSRVGQGFVELTGYGEGSRPAI